MINYTFYSQLAHCNNNFELPEAKKTLRIVRQEHPGNAAEDPKFPKLCSNAGYFYAKALDFYLSIHRVLQNSLEKIHSTITPKSASSVLRLQSNKDMSERMHFTFVLLNYMQAHHFEKKS